MNIVIIIALALLAISYVTGPQIRDASLKFSRALPASTSAVTVNTPFDTGPRTQLGTFHARDAELLLTAPAVTTAQLPDGKTFTYTIIHSDNADLSSPVNLALAAIVQTALAGPELRVLPSDAGFRATLNATSDSLITPSASGTGDASGVSATLEILF